jgi:hypothetical protein
MRWEDDDEAVKHLIMNSIPDEMLNRIRTGINTKTWWDELKKICEDLFFNSSHQVFVFTPRS